MRKILFLFILLLIVEPVNALTFNDLIASIITDFKLSNNAEENLILTKLEKEEMIKGTIDLVRNNKGYREIIELMGYKNMCLIIENDKFTLTSDFDYKEGCKKNDFEMIITNKTAKDIYNALENNNNDQIENLYKKGKIKIPLGVKFRILRKCLFNNLC